MDRKKENAISLTSGGITLEEAIKNNGPLYFMRATPFSEYGTFNYNGLLSSDFFFQNLFSETGKCQEFCDLVIDQIVHKHKNSIILIGNQGCGKSTFIHYLQRKLQGKREMRILDFDKDTSNPKLADYIEVFSSYFYNLIRNDRRYNNNTVIKLFYNLYYTNRTLILTKINGANNVKRFFSQFKDVFIENNYENNSPSEFINNINALFFNQLLSLIILWHLAEFSTQSSVSPIIFCLDNLDVLVNSEIINGFFVEYYVFLRNIDSIIQKIDCDCINRSLLQYDKMFSFVFCCRQHTWAKVKRAHLHQGNIIDLGTYEKNITEAFSKNAIWERREKYICDNQDYYNGFVREVSNVKSLIEDMNSWHSIYSLFNDDYRQCSVTFEKLLDRNPNLLSDYESVKKALKSKPLYGARGLIYKSLFDLFNSENLFRLIGVLDVKTIKPPVSDARIILNYLDYHTFGTKRSIPFESIVSDFEGIVSEERINTSLIQMFNLGMEDTLWNELIAFVQIDTDEIENCKGTKIFITKAGHEYLDLISTHFEFFNVRVRTKRINDAALFSPINAQKYIGPLEYDYNFEEIIQNVLSVVEGCCKKMSAFYEHVMFPKLGDKDQYLESAFVYENGKTKVFHGERIIHTHIRYIDNYRLFLLDGKAKTKENNNINKKLIDFIKNYISIGKAYPNVKTEKSDELFAIFEEKIKQIEDGGYTDYITAINNKDS